MKDELGGRIMKSHVALRPNTQHVTYTDSGHVNKKAKYTKKYVIKRETKFQDYKDCLKSKKISFKSQQNIQK